MRSKVERWLIAANWSMDAKELEEYKQNLFEHLDKNHPDVLLAMCNDW